MIIDYVSGAFEQPQGYYSLGWIITWAGGVDAGQILWATAIMNERNIAVSFDNKNLVSALDDRIIRAKARSR